MSMYGFDDEELQLCCHCELYLRLRAISEIRVKDFQHANAHQPSNQFDRHLHSYIIRTVVCAAGANIYINLDLLKIEV